MNETRQEDSSQKKLIESKQTTVHFEYPLNEKSISLKLNQIEPTESKKTRCSGGCSKCMRFQRGLCEGKLDHDAVDLNRPSKTAS